MMKDVSTIQILFYRKSLISSIGLRIFARSLLVTWRYRNVVFKSLCPNNFWIKTTSVPLSSKWVAKLCRSMCILPAFWMPALLFAAFIVNSKLLVLYDVPFVCPWNKYFSGLYFSLYSRIITSITGLRQKTKTSSVQSCHILFNWKRNNGRYLLPAI